MFNNQGNSKPEASQKENGDMAWACCEELVELDDVQLATVVGGWLYWPNQSPTVVVNNLTVNNFNFYSQPPTQPRPTAGGGGGGTAGTGGAVRALPAAWAPPGLRVVRL
jgi:hypothetical protein